MKKRITALILTAVLILSLSLTAFAANEETTLKFNENGKFRILMVADTQDIASPNKYTIEFLKRALDETKPDLVVFTGDNFHGPFVKTENGVKKAIDSIIAPVVERGIPFATIFGNHDDEGGVSKEFQVSVYQTYKGCLTIEGEDLTGCATYNLLINDSKNEKPVFNIWMVDSNTYAEDGTYDNVHEDQINWYVNKSNALKASNGDKVVPSILFQHIPVPEIYDLLKEVPEGTEGAVKGYSSHSDKFYIADSTKVVGGTLGEGPCSPNVNSGEFTAWKNQGDVLGAFFGHDHVNDFAGTVDGINLTYSSGEGFAIYGKGAQHGVRVIDLDENDLSTYSTKMVYFSDLFSEDEYPSNFVMTQGAAVRNIVILVACAAFILLSVIVIVIIAIVKKHKKKKALNN